MSASGLVAKAPANECRDPKCPFHGQLKVRGKIIDGVVSSDKMQKTVIVTTDHLTYVTKYGRYEKRTRRHRAHNPECIGVHAGDRVRIAECRPLSKTVSFVVIEKIEEVG
jgi:small subunit ribosomal protein S17